MRQILMATALVVTAATAAAQAPTPLAVGAKAPDFALVGAGRGGVGPAPVRLSDLRDQTVVIAFFYRARTKG
jgi:peroxiredoxin